MSNTKNNILCFVSHYSPAYKAGGPIKTIENMVEKIGDAFEFMIFTQDRDLGDEDSFAGVELGQWLRINNALVYYAGPARLTLNNIANVVRKSNPDVLYLNSFFDYHFTIKPLLARRFGMIDPYPVVLAPRGEFSKGALNLKSFKKKLYIKLANYLGLYRDIVWQASSEHEKKDIIAALKVDPSSVMIAKDLPAKTTPIISFAKPLSDGEVRLVFISRISPMKNLDFALRVLSQVKSDIIFDIYGPIEDGAYWRACSRLIDSLPGNIKVNYCGSVRPEQVGETFFRYDLFFLPTHGENYGHVIVESLSVGTPVLISDQTPWDDLENHGLGWGVSLDNTLAFVEKIEEVAGMNAELRSSWRKQVADNSIAIINCERDIADNRALFAFALNRFESNA